MGMENFEQPEDLEIEQQMQEAREIVQGEDSGGLLESFVASPLGRTLVFTAAIAGGEIGADKMMEYMPQEVTIESTVNNSEVNKEVVVPEGVELTEFTGLAKELQQELGRPATVAEVQAALTLSQEGRGEQLRDLVQVMRKGPMDGVRLMRDFIGRGEYKTQSGVGDW